MACKDYGPMPLLVLPHWSMPHINCPSLLFHWQITLLISASTSCGSDKMTGITARVNEASVLTYFSDFFCQVRWCLMTLRNKREYFSGTVRKQISSTTLVYKLMVWPWLRAPWEKGTDMVDNTQAIRITVLGVVYLLDCHRSHTTSQCWGDSPARAGGAVHKKKKEHITMNIFLHIVINLSVLQWSIMCTCLHILNVSYGFYVMGFIIILIFESYVCNNCILTCIQRSSCSILE